MGIYINIIEEINSSTLKSLYYSNSELSILKGKSKKAATKKTKAGAKKGAKKGKKFPKCTKGEKKCILAAQKKCKKGDKKCLLAAQKKCKKAENKCISHKLHPDGAGYLKASGTNVHVITINFYVRLLKMIGDKRDFGTLSKKVSHQCNNINIFAPLRESLLNCRAIGKRIKKDKSVLKTFYMGCMANLFRIVRSKCPKVFDKSSSARNIGAAIIKLTHVENKFKHRLQVDANIFVKKISFFLRVFSGLINKRYTEMEILRKIAAKKAAILRAKLAKIAKAKKEKALKLAKLKKACKGKKGKGKCKALLKKKGKKGKGKGKKGKGKKKPAKKVLKCKQNCKKGSVCK